MKIRQAVIMFAVIFAVHSFLSCDKGANPVDSSNFKSTLPKYSNTTTIHEDYWVSRIRADRRMLILTYNRSDWLRSNGDPADYSVEGFSRIDEDQSITNIKILNLADIVGLQKEIKNRINTIAAGIDRSFLLQKDTKSGVVRCFLVIKGEVVYLIVIELND